MFTRGPLDGAPGAWPAVPVCARVSEWCVHVPEHEECVHVGMCDAHVSAHMGVPAQQTLESDQPGVKHSSALPVGCGFLFWKVRMEIPSHCSVVGKIK